MNLYFTISFILFVLTAPVHAKTELKFLLGRVVGVSDGDTVKLLDSNKQQHKIRLIGIDAPEKKQDFGEVSKKSLSDLVFGKEVKVEYRKLDRYQRILGKILIDGKDVNLEQIRLGLAWHYKNFARDQDPEDREAYASTEVLAREKKLGLWQHPKPIPPWEFRHPKS